MTLPVSQSCGTPPAAAADELSFSGFIRNSVVDDEEGGGDPEVSLLNRRASSGYSGCPFSSMIEIFVTISAFASGGGLPSRNTNEMLEDLEASNVASANP